MSGIPPQVRIRVPIPEDATQWNRAFEDPEVMRYIGDGSVRDLQYYEGFVHSQIESFHNDGMCLYTVTLNEDVVGFVGFHVWAAPWGPSGEVEIGWRLSRNAWGKNVAFTAAQLARELHPAVPLMSMIHPENLNSLRLAERLGERRSAVYESPTGIHALCLRAVPESSAPE